MKWGCISGADGMEKQEREQRWMGVQQRNARGKGKGGGRGAKYSRGGTYFSILRCSADEIVCTLA